MEKYADHMIPCKFSARRTCDRSLLGLNDRIKHVLDVNESVEIGRIEPMIGFLVIIIGLDKGKRYYDDDSFSTATYVTTFSAYFSLNSILFSSQLIETTSVRYVFFEERFRNKWQNSFHRLFHLMATI